MRRLRKLCSVFAASAVVALHADSQGFIAGSEHGEISGMNCRVDGFPVLVNRDCVVSSTGVVEFFARQISVQSHGCAVTAAAVAEDGTVAVGGGDMVNMWSVDGQLLRSATVPGVVVGIAWDRKSLRGVVYDDFLEFNL